MKSWEQQAVDEIINEEEVREILRRWGVVTDTEGRMKSNEPCGCGNGDVWVKSRTKPFKWQSDVMVTTFYYTCKNCGASWTEHDSD